MFIVESYSVAVLMCVVTMLCWGSWANTQKLASREWRFPLFYWDYSFGTVLMALVFAFTLGSSGAEGRPFLADLAQADQDALMSAFIGGVIFNIANILLVAAIDISGMAVAFPVGIGLALVIGVVDNYLRSPEKVGQPMLLFAGVAMVVAAIICSALSYRRISGGARSGFAKGLILALVAGVAMGFFYGFVAKSMASDFAAPEAGLLTPYTAVVVFAVGLLVSNLLWNSWVMYRPFTGDPVTYGDYFTKGSIPLHLVGLFGGAIWMVGMAFSIIASGQAGAAISYGLGQGATMVAAAWGVFVWREFKDAPKGTGGLLTLMFALFIAGLAAIIVARG